MSFSTRMKDELARVNSTKLCCRKAEFLAFFLINGNIRIAGGLSLVMKTEHSAAARKMYALAREFDLEREVTFYRKTRLRKNHVYTLRIPPQEQMRSFFAQLGISSEYELWQVNFVEQVEQRFLHEPCCLRAYLRGAFLAAGSMIDPESGSYHLEIDSLDKRQADMLVRIMEQLGLHAKTVSRRDLETVYLKGAEQICSFMSLVGSHSALLEYESVRVNKEMRNQVNRKRNCDTANINKTVEAALRQTRDINEILSSVGIDVLPKNLREAAELRLENPESSLTELAEESGLGKSALNHRLRRLSKIAENIRTYGEEYWNNP